MPDQNKHRITVLWLPSWYPSAYDSSNGDFIERMAQAASIRVRVIVLFVEKDPELAHGQTRFQRQAESDNLVLYRLGYGSSGAAGAWQRWRSWQQFRKLQWEGFQQILQHEGAIQCLHVHVAFKAGWLALRVWRKMRIPYLVTEHWTGYLPESKPNFFDQGFFQRWLTRRIFSKCRMLLPVSRHLGASINRHIARCAVTVVPNVVDTRHFYYRPAEPGVFRFFHASYLNFQKHPEALIRAAAVLDQEGLDFELYLVGADNKPLQNLAQSLGLLNRKVFIHGPVAYTQVAEYMQQSSALVMFSRWENMPCVILEALCCGLPVISSDTGGIKEVINESNGILVPVADECALQQAMRTMILSPHQYNRAELAAWAQQQFSYQHISEMLETLYASAGQGSGRDFTSNSR